MRIPRTKLIPPAAFDQFETGDGKTVVLQQLLLNGRHELKQYHLNGASAQTIVTSHSWMVDQLINAAGRIMLQAIDRNDFALVAVGGYGRSELHPYSDIDLLLLFSRTPAVEEANAVGSFIRLLWDIGLEVGHSVRTLTECFAQSRDDVTVVTNLMESRFLCGEPSLFDELIAGIQPDCLWSPGDFLAAKRSEQAMRYHRYDDTAYNLEPHLKEGPGALRDLHMISWIGRRTLGATTLNELLEQRLVSPNEFRSLIRARNLLWRMRNCLHFRAARREDRLLFQHQREIALFFGYEDTRTLAVEKLMKRYYRAVHDIQLLNELLLQDFDETIRGPIPANHSTIVNRRFKSFNGLLEMRREDIFRRHPFALLEVFYLFQNDDELTAIGARTIRRIRASLKLIGDDFRSDIRCRSLFIEILRAKTRTTRALKLMNEYGVLGAYIPAFGRIVGQMQHDLFHHYTVDTHLLFVVEKLRRLQSGEIRPDHQHAIGVMHTLYKPYRVLIAALFHDIAKGRGGDHSTLGESEARNFCSRHDMSKIDSEMVAWLVRHHLSMSWTAQKADISDVDVIERFSVLVKDQAHLDNLYLLTIADMMGTNPYVWNEWKGQLLLDLYLATARTLRRGLSNPSLLSEVIRERQNEALTDPSLQKYPVHAITTFWEQVDQDYFVRHTPATISWLTDMLLSTSLTELPLVTARHQPETETFQYLVCAPDSETLFSQITASFDHQNMNIVDARVHSIKSGLVLHLFVVLPITSVDDEHNLMVQHTQAIRKHLLQPSPAARTELASLPRVLKQFPTQTLVTFSDPPGGLYTIMEITAQDRPGLLHQVANSLLNCKVLLNAAKVSTVGEKAEDVFYITDRDGLPISDPARRNEISDTIAANLLSM